MAHDIQFEEELDCLHVRVSGEKSIDTICASHDAICEASNARGISRLLIEERLDGPALSTFDLYDIVSRASRQGAAKYEAIAYVDESPDSKLEFAETLAVNRGLAVAAFDSVSAAKRWLRGSRSSIANSD